MKILSIPESSLISLCALGAVLWLGVQGRAEQRAAAQQASGSADTQVEAAEVRSGPFLIAGENYTVVVQQKRLASASESAFSQTLARVEIVDAVSYTHLTLPTICSV